MRLLCSFGGGNEAVSDQKLEQGSYQISMGSAMYEAQFYGMKKALISTFRWSQLPFEPPEKPKSNGVHHSKRQWLQELGVWEHDQNDSFLSYLLSCMHVDLFPQGSDFSLLLLQVFLDNIFDLHCLFSGHTLTIKVFRVLLQLGEREPERDQ